MSKVIKCDKCGEITKADSSEEKMFTISVKRFTGCSVFDICSKCLNLFYADYLGWIWDDDEKEFTPKDGET